MRIALLPVGGYLFSMAIAIALLAVVLFVPLRHTITGWRRRTLVGLRMAIVLLVILAMLRPSLVYTTSRRRPSTLVLLVDQSRSMQVADAFGNKTRWQALEQVLGDSAPILDDLKDDLEIKVYRFDADAAPLAFSRAAIDLPKQPEGNQTAIGSALAEVLKREAGKRLAGVVLLTDGAQRAYAPHDLPPQIPARQMADLGFPLHTVVFGKTGGASASRDVAMADLEASDNVFVKNELTVDAAAKVHGFANDKIPVQLLFEMAPGKMSVVGRGEVTATSDGERVPVELSYVPQTPGEYKVTVRAESPPGDAAPANNELSTFVTVRKGGINVLYLEGAHPVEAKFIRRALAASPDLHLDYVWIDAQTPDTRPADLVSRFAPGKYDVYIIGDLDASAFRPEELTRLAETVRAGAGFAMLGGLHSFGPGGYQKTALAEILPIKMGPLERQQFGATIAADLHVAGPLKAQPTATGEQSRIMLLAPAAKNRTAWAELPPLEGANRFRSLAPLANVLLETGEGRAPLLVAQTPGNGRAMAFAADSTWRWAMQGHDDLHKRFWRQIVLWLAKKDQQNEGNVWLQLAQRRYQPGARVEFTAGVMGSDGEPVTDVALACEVTGPDGAKKPARIGRQDDRYAGTFAEASDAGDYTISVTARRGSETLGTAQSRFLVYESDLELENPAADALLLESLANTTHGTAMDAKGLVSYFERMKSQPPQPLVEVEAKKTPWDTWPYFLTLVGLMTCDWALRKRWGLV